jgi:hypothetical protein
MLYAVKNRPKVFSSETSQMIPPRGHSPEIMAEDHSREQRCA